MPREWFSIRLLAETPPPDEGDEKKPADPASAGPTLAEIHLNDYIGDWIDQAINEMLGTSSPTTAKAFVDSLSALPDSVKALRVHINSPGGDVMGALAITNALRDQRVTKGRTVETIVDGLAASSASLVAMAGSPVTMADNALLMIHQPWSVSVGNAAEMRKAADVLDEITDGSIIPTYQWHSKKKAETIRGLMDAETWMDADEAIAAGFADEKVAGLKAAASIDPRGLAKLRVPERYAERVSALARVDVEAVPAPAAPEPPAEPAADAAPPEPEPEPLEPGVPVVVDAVPAGPVDARRALALCREAGLDLDFADGLLAANVPEADARTRIAAEREQRARATQRATDIRSICRVAHQDDLADDLIASGMTTTQVRNHLSKLAAKLDRVEIDAGLVPDHGTTRRTVIDHAAVYEQLNAPRLPGLRQKED